MTILLTIFWFKVVAAFISGVTGRPFWCVVNIVLAVLMALMAMAYEGRLLNRVKSSKKKSKI